MPSGRTGNWRSSAFASSLACFSRFSRSRCWPSSSWDRRRVSGSTVDEACSTVATLALPEDQLRCRLQVDPDRIATGRAVPQPEPGRQREHRVPGPVGGFDQFGRFATGRRDHERGATSQRGVEQGGALFLAGFEVGFVGRFGGRVFDFDRRRRVLREDCGRREEEGFQPSAGSGPVARATLYFLLRYPRQVGDTERELTAGRLEMLLRWHENDPVSEYERHRNAAVYELQGNRNPLIDRPDWARELDFAAAWT